MVMERRASRVRERREEEDGLRVCQQALISLISPLRLNRAIHCDRLPEVVRGEPRRSHVEDRSR